MRRIGRHKRNKQKKILIIGSLSLLLFLCAGYAAFSTNLNITARGNIMAKDITKDVVTEGDGLYKDPYEEGRYVYRGSEPDNYIWFNNELWRILAKEQDGTYKIVRNELLPNNQNYVAMAFDEANHRLNANNSFCTNTTYGCAVYAAINGNFQTLNGKYSGTVTEDSSIKIYLNGEYYTGLTVKAKEQIQTHSFNIGPVEYKGTTGQDSITQNIAGEKKYTWTGNIGLINVSDLLRASTNGKCTSVTDQYNASLDGQSYCPSYLMTLEVAHYWTINMFSNDTDIDNNSSILVWNTANRTSIANQHRIVRNGANRNDIIGVRPVVYLKSDLVLTGQGTQSEPFKIVG